jgi:hypothetical protein
MPLGIVHKSTGLLFWFVQAIAAVSDHAEFDRPVVDDPTSVVVFGKTDRLADESLADVDRAAVPLDLAVVTHAPDAVVGALTGLAQYAVVATRRGRIAVGRRGVVERLVRTLFIVETLEGLQLPDLLAFAPAD